MRPPRVLILNRGEIALRLAQSAYDLNLEPIVVHTKVEKMNIAAVSPIAKIIEIPGEGAMAYLDTEYLIGLVSKLKCDLVHPGYGFLSENADFAEAVENVGKIWVGPKVGQLRLFGNKLSAKDHAEKCGVPVLKSSRILKKFSDLEEYLIEFSQGYSFLLKAAYGGGGRGIREVNDKTDIEKAFSLAQGEAEKSFGNGGLYLEEYFEDARHIEIQIIGDGKGAVRHLGDRDCSLQRKKQKIIELSPATSLSEKLREKLFENALNIAKSVDYRGLGTVEFLVNPNSERFCFIEMNPRLQVEHTVTEMLFGIDLVQAQFQLALGWKLKDVLKNTKPMATGQAIQLRVNAEKRGPSGLFQPSTGRIEKLNLPVGIGIRVDTAIRQGYEVTSDYDSLIAKLIVHSTESDLSLLLRKAIRVLKEFEIEGVDTNINFLGSILEHEAVKKATYTIHFIDGLISSIGDNSKSKGEKSLEQGGRIEIEAPIRGNVIAVSCLEGEEVSVGRGLMIIEAMKMHHEIVSPANGTIERVTIEEGDLVDEGQGLFTLVTDGLEVDGKRDVIKFDLEKTRQDLQELNERNELLLDENRPDALAKRRRIRARTARENVEDLCDAGTFFEYGGLAIAAQRRRKSVDELQRTTPADGMIAGFGTINSALFGEEKTKCAVLAYDYTVLAGTQGHNNHKKKDRIFELAKEWETPVVIFTEGGGGRPGDVDTDDLIMSWLDIKTFATWPQLSGIAPRIAINSGRCFAGNAVLFGCADITIATKNSNIGLAGPAMIEGGGLGKFKPEDIGPSEVQSKNGVIDLLVENEQDATQKAKQLLGYFQGRVEHSTAADQRMLRHLVPENRLRVYDIRQVIRTLADTDSVVELRQFYGVGIITAFLRLDGNPFGLIANDPCHLGGAIDGEGGEKGARFLQLCDSYDIPVISLCDTPGFMVGPDSEKTASVRRGSRLITASANLSVPLFTVVIRKGYGLGAQAMAGGSFHQPFFTIGWPTSEMGPMGLEGAVELGFSKELSGAINEEERTELFGRLLSTMYSKGKGISVASSFEIDAVIDPRDTRDWLLKGLKASNRSGEKISKRGYPDVW